MGRKRKWRVKIITQPSLNCAYTLKDVRSKIAQGKYRVTKDAYGEAHRDFGWGGDDIEDALSKLQHRHFFKTMRSRANPGVILDVYHAQGLRGENVYIHFYFQGGLLIINSIKKLK